MKTILLITSGFLLYSCSPIREPNYHLFEHSTLYPDYSEYKHLVSKGFEIKTIEDTLYLVNSKANIELQFKIEDESITVKKTIVRIDKFDTLVAENVMKTKFNGIKQSDWKILSDSTYLASVKYELDIYKIYLKYRQEAFLESKVDFFHRAIK